MDTKKLSFGVIKEVASRLSIPVTSARRRIICDDPEVLFKVAEVENEWSEKRQLAISAVNKAIANRSQVRG